jgi:hypothetical protein
VKLADVVCDCGCGRQVVQPRGGGPRKRFFENACRARWTRKGKQQKAGGRAPASSAGSDDRQATLEWLREQLEKDIRTLGTLVPTKDSVKANPSVAGLCRVIADLDRRSQPEQQEEPDVITSLRAI